MEENMFTNPVLDGCADPDVIYYEGTYYLYATNTDMKDDSEMGFKVYTSKDLVHWHDAGMALKACDSWGEKQFWAPDIIYTNGLFYLLLCTPPVRPVLFSVWMAALPVPLLRSDRYFLS